MSLHPTLAKVTDRIIERSKDSRRRYLDLIDRQHEAGVEHAAICQAGQHLSYERLLQASRHEVLLLTLQLVKS